MDVIALLPCHIDHWHLATLLVNLCINYLLLFMMLSSLMVTLVRDPGPVKPLEELEGEDEGTNNDNDDEQREDNEGISLAEALLSRQEGGQTESFSLMPVKSNGESRWCRKVRTRFQGVRYVYQSMLMVIRGCSAGRRSLRERTTVASAIAVC